MSMSSTPIWLTKGESEARLFGVMGDQDNRVALRGFIRLAALQFAGSGRAPANESGAQASSTTAGVFAKCWAERKHRS